MKITAVVLWGACLAILATQHSVGGRLAAAAFGVCALAATVNVMRNW